MEIWLIVFFFFQAEDGIRDRDGWLEFRRVLFRSQGFVAFLWSYYKALSLGHRCYKSFLVWPVCSEWLLVREVEAWNVSAERRTCCSLGFYFGFILWIIILDISYSSFIKLGMLCRQYIYNACIFMYVYSFTTERATLFWLRTSNALCVVCG